MRRWMFLTGAHACFGLAVFYGLLKPIFAFCSQPFSVEFDGDLRECRACLRERPELIPGFVQPRDAERNQQYQTHSNSKGQSALTLSELFAPLNILPLEIGQQRLPGFCRLCYFLFCLLQFPTP